KKVPKHRSTSAGTMLNLTGYFVPVLSIHDNGTLSNNNPHINPIFKPLSPACRPLASAARRVSSRALPRLAARSACL
ncbi:hypothetical protein XENOCAPTIV_022299, partial [Xenoophorus captivus]